jgi:hypothetical protein
MDYVVLGNGVGDKPVDDLYVVTFSRMLKNASELVPFYQFCWFVVSGMSTGKPRGCVPITDTPNCDRFYTSLSMLA